MTASIPEPKAVVNINEEKKPNKVQQKNQSEVIQKWKKAKIIPCVNPNCP